MIADNVGAGVIVGDSDTDDSVDNEILGNSIYSNTGIGIDLGHDGVSLNAPDRPQSGPNLFQSYPVITAANLSASSTVISGTLNSTLGNTFTIQFFANASADVSGYGQGETYLGEITNVQGISTFNNVVLPPAPPGEPVITATATDSNGNTSEFSAAFPFPYGNSLVVENTNDTGAGSLRSAIHYADTLTGLQTITFAIPGTGVQTIQLLEPAPPITTPVWIDGTSQPGFSGTPLIELDGGAVTTAGNDGLTFDSGSGGSTVTGLTIGNFTGDKIVLNSDSNLIAGDDIGTDDTGTISDPNGEWQNGILINSAGNTIGGTSALARDVISANEAFGVAIEYTYATGNIVEGDYIGTDVTGTHALGNAYSGVLVLGGTGNTIGGTAAGTRNVISGTLDNNGVYLSGNLTSANVVEGDYIGTDVTGTVALGNAQDGVAIEYGAFDNTIGGTIAAARNVISGNALAGVGLAEAVDNVVEGNYIGTDVTGTVAVANGVDGGNQGIAIVSGSSDNTIGGTTALARNLISGNAGFGVTIADDLDYIEQGLYTFGNVVEGNFIGTDVTGALALGNGTDGIQISQASGNTIGGTAGGAGNVIGDNQGDGVAVDAGDAGDSIDDAILGNWIYGNDGLGIDLGADGVTPNHSSPTTGVIAGAPNGDQNFPVIASATFVPDASDSNGTLIVSGSLAADFGPTYIIQLFANASPDTTGYGQGELLIASFDATTDSETGDTVFSTSIPTTSFVTGEVISATATDPDFNTSEFAQDVVVTSGTGSSVTIPVGDGAAATAAALQVAVSELQSLPSGSTPPAVLLQLTSVSELGSVIAAINGLSSQATPPITVIVDLSGQTYQADTTLDAPSGIDVMIQNGTLIGGSPALIVNGGSVTLDNVLATNATSAPTILVNAGSLSVRNSTIDGPPVTGEAAFSIIGGTVDLGTTSSPGGNTINISTDTQFVQNATSTPVPTVGDTFTLNGTTQTATELSFTFLTGPTTPTPFGQSVALSVAVAPDYTGDPAPSGAVYFLDETTGTTLGPATLSSGKATFPTTTLPVGINDLIALYSGDSRYLLTLSAPFSVTVSPAAALTVTSIAPVTPNPRNATVASVNVTFSAPINLATVTAGAILLTDNGGPNLITGSVAMSLVSGSTYQIGGLSSLTTAQGEYTLTVNSAEIQDQNGIAGTNSLSTEWLMDTTPPTSSVSALPARETSLVFPVSATGSDGGSPPSGVASYDIYSSTNGGKWTFWTNVPASGAPASFSGQSNTTYSFFSVAHDLARNVQADKPVIEASTYVPNLTPPVTIVDGTTVTNPSTVNTATGTFTLNLTGSDPGGGVITFFEVFVSVDSGAYQEVGPYAIPAGAADSNGNYHSAMSYQGLTDGQSHAYSFYSIGLDSAGNMQIAPTSPNVTFSSEVFAVPAQLQVTSFTVEHDSPSRSYVRYLDIGFNESDSQSGGDLTAIVEFDRHVVAGHRDL